MILLRVPEEEAKDAIWIRANHRVANTLIKLQKGEISSQQAQELGLFPLQRALPWSKACYPCGKHCLSMTSVRH